MFKARVDLVILADDGLPDGNHAIMTQDGAGGVVLRMAAGLGCVTTRTVLAWAFGLLVGHHGGAHAYVCGRGDVTLVA